MYAWNRLFIDQASMLPPLLAAFLLVLGVIVLLMGWRLSRLVAALDFSLFGIVVGAALSRGTDLQWLGAGIGAIAFGGLALWMDHYAEVVACGLLAGMLAAIVTGWTASPLAAMLLVMVVAFGCAVALSAIAHRQASAVMTGVQGGLVAAFGLAACLSHSGAIWSGVREVLASSMGAQILFVLAPIGVGLAFQLAAIQNEEVVAH